MLAIKSLWELDSHTSYGTWMAVFMGISTCTTSYIKTYNP